MQIKSNLKKINEQFNFISKKFLGKEIYIESQIQSLGDKKKNLQKEIEFFEENLFGFKNISIYANQNDIFGEIISYKNKTCNYYSKIFLIKINYF